MIADDLEDRFDELEAPQEHIERRVADWLSRLTLLFNGIRDWATRAGWTVEDDDPVRMSEEPMWAIGMAERQQPALRLHNGAGLELWIRPKGLWVIGANGRVDLYSGKGAFILVDLAEPFQHPQWVLHIIGKQKGRPFSPDLLADLV